MRFALDGRDLEIDLSDKNAANLRKALRPIRGSQDVRLSASSERHPPAGRKVAAGASGIDHKEEFANVRAWERTTGYEVTHRGRIKGHIVKGHRAALLSAEAW